MEERVEVALRPRAFELHGEGGVSRRVDGEVRVNAPFLRAKGFSLGLEENGGHIPDILLVQIAGGENQKNGRDSRWRGGADLPAEETIRAFLFLSPLANFSAPIGNGTAL